MLIVLNTRYSLDAARHKHIAQDDLLLEELYEGAFEDGGRKGSLQTSSSSPLACAAARGLNGSPGIHSLLVSDPQQPNWAPFACHGLRATDGVVYTPHAQPEQPDGGGGAQGPRGSKAAPLLRGGGGFGAEAVPLQATLRAPLATTAVTREYAAGLACGRREPKPADIAAVAAQEAASQARAHPAEQRLVVHRFSPAVAPVASRCCSTTASIGALRVFRGLTTTVPKVCRWGGDQEVEVARDVSYRSVFSC